MLLLALAAATAAPNDYRRDDAWLCRPGRNDVCAGDTGLTIVTRGGRMTRAAAPQRARRDIDCFYVYPTVSLDPGDNSDMHADREEQGMTRAQFAPFRQACRTFAPLYRQVTLTALREALGGGAIPGDFALAYADVRAAWRDYLARDNGGRAFVLVGHSQGSSLLKRLVTEEIDGKPVARRMLSAILPGTAVLVPTGATVGGDFAHVPLCRATGQTGCVVTWASYRDAAPPPANALFGVSRRPGFVAGCTNPARLAGGDAPLDGMLGFPWWRGGVAQYARPAAGWSVAGKAVATPFVAVPGLLRGHCAQSGDMRYLAVHVTPAAARAPLDETVAGHAAIGDTAYPDWGFHVVDTAIVEGDLLRLVRRQASAYRAARKGRRRPA